VELDIEYANLAERSGVPHYVRVPAVGTHPLFIAGLAAQVRRAIGGEAVVTCGDQRICPQRLVRCGYGAANA